MVTIATAKPKTSSISYYIDAILWKRFIEVKGFIIPYFYSNVPFTSVSTLLHNINDMHVKPTRYIVKQ
jgi:hypothetical protein